LSSESESPRLTSGWTFVLSIALTVAISALLAPPLYQLLVTLGLIGDDEFLRVFRRLLMIGLCLSILVAWKPWRDGDLTSYGLRGPRARFRPAFVAWLLAVAATIALVLVQYWFGWIRLEEPFRWGRFLNRIATFLVSGFAVSLLEEWFFRGWMLRRLSRTRSLGRAIFTGTLIFAVLHAFSPSQLSGLAIEPTAHGALSALTAWFGLATDFRAFGSSFVGLFLFGLLLCGAYLRTRTVWVPVAIHAGAVAVLFTYTHATDRVVSSAFVGTKALYDGVPAYILLAIVTVAVWNWKPTSASRRVSGMATTSAATIRNDR
jgi:membrane protease YdiL (CAAX protease family)